MKCMLWALKMTNPVLFWLFFMLNNNKWKQERTGPIFEFTVLLHHLLRLSFSLFSSDAVASFLTFFLPSSLLALAFFSHNLWFRLPGVPRHSIEMIFWRTNGIWLWILSSWKRDLFLPLFLLKTSHTNWLWRDSHVHSLPLHTMLP